MILSVNFKEKVQRSKMDMLSLSLIVEDAPLKTPGGQHESYLKMSTRSPLHLN